MDKLLTAKQGTLDYRLCIASIAVVYSPLVLMLVAAAVLF